MYVHHPAELPVFGQHEIIYGLVNERTFLHISPKLVKTDERLRSWTPYERGCYYSYERRLKFYKVYTNANCLNECEANLTLANCLCNILPHPRELKSY